MKTSSIDSSLQLFNSLVGDIFADVDQPYRPALTIFEHEDRFVIECDLPGVAIDHVKVEVNNGILEISGSRDRAELPQGSSMRFDERGWKSFSRRVKLDESVNSAAVTADYVDGVLIVSAPRREETLPQKITIRRTSDES